MSEVARDARALAETTPWLTPLTLDRPLEELPTLDELFHGAWHIGTCETTQVSQYLRAAKVRTGPIVRIVKAAERADEADNMRKPRVGNNLLLQLAPVTGGDSNVANYAARRYVGNNRAFESEEGFCRFCPEFSAYYGHRIYICKRPAVA